MQFKSSLGYLQNTSMKYETIESAWIPRTSISLRTKPIIMHFIINNAPSSLLGVISQLHNRRIHNNETGEWSLRIREDRESNGFAKSVIACVMSRLKIRVAIGDTRDTTLTRMAGRKIRGFYTQKRKRGRSAWTDGAEPASTREHRLFNRPRCTEFKQYLLRAKTVTFIFAVDRARVFFHADMCAEHAFFYRIVKKSPLIFFLIIAISTNCMERRWH